MATEKHTAETILQYLTEVADARLRPMMGEYLVYVDDIVIGQINEGELFHKDDFFRRTVYFRAAQTCAICWRETCIRGTVRETCRHRMARRTDQWDGPALPKPRRWAKRV